MKTRKPAIGEWTYGNQVRILENGEDYYPAVFEAIANARHEVLLETFLIFDDEVGRQLQAALLEAARRGVRVVATADGYGAPDLGPDYVGPLVEAGVDFRWFDPRPRVFGMRLNLFRRLHRKIVVVDRELGFIGGINYSMDHLRRGGPESKQDYALEVRGPIVRDLWRLADALHAPEAMPRTGPWWRRWISRCDDVRARREPVALRLVWRDNDHHRNDIEAHYRLALRQAQREVLIANAYFFPGYRFVRDLRRAAQRGVRVRLLLQGSADKAVVTWAARSLYKYLARAGVRIHEYCERPFHGKVAVIDDHWVTVGSSNLDPTSLSLNLEANLIAQDASLARQMRERLERLIAHHCKEVDPADIPPQPLWRQWAGYAVFHLMRRFPHWGLWLPRREQPLLGPDPEALVAPVTEDDAAPRETSLPAR